MIGLSCLRTAMKINVIETSTSFYFSVVFKEIFLITTLQSRISRLDRDSDVVIRSVGLSQTRNKINEVLCPDNCNQMQLFRGHNVHTAVT